MQLNIVSTRIYCFGIHLCNNILIFQGRPENGPACHAALGTGLYILYSTEITSPDTQIQVQTPKVHAQTP